MSAIVTDCEQTELLPIRAVEMKKKIYLIQPTYRNIRGDLLKGKKIDYPSLALPALSVTIPQDWEKEFCFEYFTQVNFDTEAEVIGISSMGYDILRGVEIAKEFKRRGKIVLFGGSQVPFSQQEIIPYCDAIVFGCPGPEQMQQILDDCASHQLSMTYQCGVHINFPFDYSVLADKKTRFTPVLSSIGCRNRCAFCCNAEITHGHYHLRDVETVIKDIRAARRKSRRLVFSDANLFNHRDHLYRLLSKMIEENYHCLWGAQCTIDIGDDAEILHLLWQAGCRLLFIGIETLQQKNMDDLEKNIDVHKHEQRITAIRKAGIAVGGYFILGLDKDTGDSCDGLYEFIHRNRIAWPVLNILIPIPGTRMFEKLKDENRLLVHSINDFLTNNECYASSGTHALFVPKNMTKPELEKNLLTLFKKLTTFKEIVYRSQNRNIFNFLSLVFLNLGMRKEYMAVKRSSRNRQNGL